MIKVRTKKTLNHLKLMQFFKSNQSFLSPLHSFSQIEPSKKIAPQLIKTLLSDVELIYGVSTKLYGLLEKRLEQTPHIDDLLIGDIFASMVHVFPDKNIKRKLKLDLNRNKISNCTVIIA